MHLQPPETNPIDIHLGARLREARLATRTSQAKLGERLGVSFQQVGKYESGANRISASTLIEAARALGKPVTYFCEGLEAQ